MFVTPRKYVKTNLNTSPRTASNTFEMSNKTLEIHLRIESPIIRNACKTFETFENNPKHKPQNGTHTIGNDAHKPIGRQETRRFSQHWKPNAVRNERASTGRAHTAFLLQPPKWRRVAKPCAGTPRSN